MVKKEMARWIHYKQKETMLSTEPPHKKWNRLSALITFHIGILTWKKYSSEGEKRERAQGGETYPPPCALKALPLDVF